MHKVFVVLVLGLFPLTAAAAAKETYVEVQYSNDDFTDEPTVTLVLGQQKDIVTNLIFTGHCSRKRTGLLLDFGPHFIIDDWVQVQYRFDKDKPRSEFWRWAIDNNAALTMSKKKAFRLAQSKRVAVRFRASVAVYDLTNHQDKMKEFGDACKKILGKR